MDLRLKHSGRSLLSGLVVALAFILWQSTDLPANALAPQAKAADRPFVVEYYYKVEWGHADEFIRLFKKNHYPLLKKQLELGNALAVTVESPVHHATEDGSGITASESNGRMSRPRMVDSGDEQILKQLFPDQEMFEREEQRRFEILLAHWDVPVSSVDLEEKVKILLAMARLAMASAAEQFVPLRNVAARE